MKEEIFKRKIYKEKFDDDKITKHVAGGKEEKDSKKLKEFTQKETQEEWIDLMGIPKK